MQCLNHALALSAVMNLIASAIAFSYASMVLAFASRRILLGISEKCLAMKAEALDFAAWAQTSVLSGLIAVVFPAGKPLVASGGRTTPPEGAA